MSDRGGRLFLAFMLITVGVFFSVATYFPRLIRADQWWPLFVLVPGVAMLATALVGGLGRSRGMAALAIPGSIVTTVGMLLMYTNNTGRWEIWAYAWTLILGSVGFGLLLASRFGAADQGAGRVGGWLLAIGAAGFVLMGAVFEGLIFRRYFTRWWPVGLVLLGVVVLFTARRESR
jgi:hypothetical protein